MAIINSSYSSIHRQVSISKAVSSSEVPLKVKHARVAIIATFHSRGAHSFWAVALRQPLQVSDAKIRCRKSLDIRQRNYLNKHEKLK